MDDFPSASGIVMGVGWEKIRAIRTSTPTKGKKMWAEIP